MHLRRRPLLTAATSALLACACGSSKDKDAGEEPGSAEPGLAPAPAPSLTHALEPWLRDALSGATALRLYRLDPIPRPPGSSVNALPAEFHGYRILEQVEVEGAAASEELLAHVRKGLDEASNLLAACFNPRHGITVRKPGNSIDLLICYECLQVKVFDGGQATHLTSRSVERDVDAFFAARMK